MEIVHIREMNLIDIPEVVHIESASFEFPWTEEEFSNCLKRKKIHKNTFGFVVEQKELIIGYLIYQLHRRRACILNTAIKHEKRKLGVFAQLFNTLLLQLMLVEHCKTISLKVRDTNLNAQLAFRNIGFKATSILKDYYEDTENNQEDAYIMQYKLPSHGFCVTNSVSSHNHQNY